MCIRKKTNFCHKIWKFSIKIILCNALDNAEKLEKNTLHVFAIKQVVYPK